MIRQLVKKAWSVGDKVKFYLARYDDIYTGKISAVHSNGTYDIEYMSGSTKVVKKGIQSKDIFPYKHGNTAQQVASMQKMITSLQQDVQLLTMQMEKQVQTNQLGHETMTKHLESLALKLLEASKTIEALGQQQNILGQQQQKISTIVDQLSQAYKLLQEFNTISSSFRQRVDARITELENLIDEFED